MCQLRDLGVYLGRLMVDGVQVMYTRYSSRLSIEYRSWIAIFTRGSGVTCRFNRLDCSDCRLQNLTSEISGDFASFGPPERGSEAPRHFNSVENQHVTPTRPFTTTRAQFFTDIVKAHSFRSRTERLWHAKVQLEVMTYPHLPVPMASS